MNNEFRHVVTTTVILPTKSKAKKKRRMIKGYGGKKMDHNENHPMFEKKQMSDAEAAVRQVAEAINHLFDDDKAIKEENIQRVIKQMAKECSDEKVRVDLDKSCLEEAAKIIHGNRQDDYGTPEDSFQRIADYWNAYLCHNSVTDVEHSLYAKDVAMMMVLFKIAREEHQHKHDNCTDICGYTAILDNMYKD